MIESKRYTKPIDNFLICQDLILELRELENLFMKLMDDKLNYEGTINKFNSNFALRVGGVISEILALREGIYGKKKQPITKFSPFKPELIEKLREIFNSLEDAPNDEPNGAEQQQLKAAFRKASRLCHPDKLTEDDKAKGEEIFKDLNDAYQKQDLQRVQSILLTLEKESNFSDTIERKIEDRNVLEQKINLLWEQIFSLEAEIQSIKESEIYKRIQSITDLDDYFYKIESELQSELENLKSLQNTI